jgi:diaminohydroxyphosphoribosylaminopyrimidine deaminase / 5-amino-6-(5-phosphoribosylamino)uracil reductase
VAVGGGTARADAPRLDARDVPTPRGQPRRLVFSRHEFDGLERRSGPLADELRALGGEGVQSLLLEGGPTLAAAFLEADLIDKLMLFVAPRFSGSGPRFLPALGSSLTLSHLTAQPVGEDVLLETYVHLP